MTRTDEVPAVRCGAWMPGDRLNGPRCDLPFGHEGDHMADDRYIWRGL